MAPIGPADCCIICSCLITHGQNADLAVSSNAGCHFFNRGFALWKPHFMRTARGEFFEKRFKMHFPEFHHQEKLVIPGRFPGRVKVVLRHGGGTVMACADMCVCVCVKLMCVVCVNLFHAYLVRYPLKLEVLKTENRKSQANCMQH